METTMAEFIYISIPRCLIVRVCHFPNLGKTFPQLNVTIIRD